MKERSEKPGRESKMPKLLRFYCIAKIQFCLRENCGTWKDMEHIEDQK